MKTGKLDSKLLEEMVFRHFKFKRPEVITGPGIGEDCALVDFGRYECVLSTDPITGAVADIGRLAIQVSCNDIASKGIEPLGILLACMLPEGTAVEEIDEIMRQAGDGRGSRSYDYRRAYGNHESGQYSRHRIHRLGKGCKRRVAERIKYASRGLDPDYQAGRT